MKSLSFRAFWCSVVALMILVAAGCNDAGPAVVPEEPFRPADGRYTVVTYNVENLFDADAVAVYDDYKPVDAEGNDQYTPQQVLNKVKNIVRLMRQYNDGAGPDILMLVEVEADFTPEPVVSAESLLEKYRATTLEQMLGSGFDDEIADLPSQFLLLKAFWDAGVRDYRAVAPEPPAGGDGLPSAVVKNAVITRLPVIEGRTQIHPVDDARPILEVWLEVDGHPLVTFTNHWKSGASDPALEKVRVQNATVLKQRIDALRDENPAADIIVSGDLNSDYNQAQRYRSMSTTGINGVLQATGDEASVARGESALYNLWYELPADQRRSDNYYENWGTLMHLIVSQGLYDREGISYVDGSFEVGIFPGLNANSVNGNPIRWTSAAGGIGFSDHFPLSMKIEVSAEQEGRIEPANPGVENASNWRPLKVEGVMPPADQIISLQPDRVPQYLNAEYYDRFFEVTGRLTPEGKLRVGETTFDLFAPGFRLPQVLADRIQNEEEITFIGRLSNFRNRWQFIIDGRSFIR